MQLEIIEMIYWQFSDTIQQLFQMNNDSGGIKCLLMMIWMEFFNDWLGIVCMDGWWMLDAVQDGRQLQDKCERLVTWESVKWANERWWIRLPAIVSAPTRRIPDTDPSRIGRNRPEWLHCQRNQTNGWLTQRPVSHQIHLARFHGNCSSFFVA